MNQTSTVKQRFTFKDFFLIVAVVIIALIPFFGIGVNNKNIITILSFLLNGIIFITGMCTSQKKSSVSVELVYWIFMFFFMYFAPLIQYLSSIYPWRGSFSNRDIFYINLVVLLFNTFFIIGKNSLKRVNKKRITNVDIAAFLCSGFELGKKSRIIMTTVAFLLAAYSMSQTGIAGIVVSRVQATQAFYSGGNSAIELVVESVIPAFMAYIVAEAAQNVSAKKEKYSRLVFLLICLLVCFFPTSLPRYKTITIYGTVLLLVFPGLKKKQRFFWLFILALVFAFPLMNAFRHVISMESMGSVYEEGFFPVYMDADYDTYRMLGSAIRYVRVNGIACGRQLLGVFLFFVPSAIWRSKPGGSGALLIRDEFGNDVAANVSCPFIGEGYLNFGIPGVIIFGLFLGFLIKKLDNYYKSVNQEKEYFVFSPYLFTIFLTFFILRGDLLSGFAYLCGFIATGYIIKIIAKYL